MPIITIDGKQYDTETLPDQAKQQLLSIQYVDAKLNELQAEAAVLQTARAAYGKALTEALPKTDDLKQ